MVMDGGRGGVGFWIRVCRERGVQAVTVRPLSSVSALVRFAEEPQMFAIEFSDGCPIHVSFCCAI